MIGKLFRRSQTSHVIAEEELARRLVDPDYCAQGLDTPLRAGTGVVRPEAPFGWKAPPEPQPDEAFELGGAEIFTENYARRDGNNLLRADLPIPVKGTAEQVFIGIWCSLKTGNHARFRSAQARGDAEKLGDMFSWLYTQLPRLTGPLLTAGVLVPFPAGRMPFYWITDQKHPFYAAQRDGMTAPEILEIYEAFGCSDIVALLKT